MKAPALVLVMQLQKMEITYNIVAAGMDKSDAVIQLIKDGALICTMAQNPDVMGYEGMYAAITAINDGKVAPEYIDTGVSILNLDAVK